MDDGSCHGTCIVRRGRGVDPDLAGSKKGAARGYGRAAEEGS